MHPFHSGMKWGHEIVRTCLAGTIMHVVIVAACSAGGGGADPAPTFSAGGNGRAVDVPGTGVPGNAAVPGTERDAKSGPARADAAAEAPTFVPIAEAQAAESGTRLKARWQVAEDGARQFVFQWHDSLRGETCSFTTAADGVLRCLPSTYAALTAYTNDSCTQRAFGFAPTCGNASTPNTALVFEQANCGTLYRAFELGAAVSSTGLYVISGASCISTGSTYAAYTFHLAGAEIAPGNFVAATEQIDP